MLYTTTIFLIYHQYPHPRNLTLFHFIEFILGSYDYHVLYNENDSIHFV